MRTRSAAVLALLLGLLVPAAPAIAAPRVSITGQVLDETGRGVAGAHVSVTADVLVEVQPGFGLVDAVFCLFSLGFFCDEEPPEWKWQRIGVAARTDGRGRYALRFDQPVKDHRVHRVDITAPSLVRWTLPPTTSASVSLRGVRTMPTFRVWTRGPSLDPAGGTRRRLRAGVPSALGRPVRPAQVVLVQGAETVWSYGEVAGDRDVDTRVVEEGTTGTQATVTTRIGSMSVAYRSGVRPVSRPVRPMSRGKPCSHRPGLFPEQIDGCSPTDGTLGSVTSLPGMLWEVVVDLGELTVPEAYIARECGVVGVSASVDGVVYLDVDVEQRERGVHTGRPDLPARYVQVRLDGCYPPEVSVFGAPFDPLPAAPAAPPLPVAADLAL